MEGRRPAKEVRGNGTPVVSMTLRYRINWENPEYASKDKEGVANRYPL